MQYPNLLELAISTVGATYMERCSLLYPDYTTCNANPPLLPRQAYTKFLLVANRCNVSRRVVLVRLNSTKLLCTMVFNPIDIQD